jgi:hypothetical protein
MIERRTSSFRYREVKSRTSGGSPTRAPHEILPAVQLLDRPARRKEFGDPGEEVLVGAEGNKGSHEDLNANGFLRPGSSVSSVGAQRAGDARHRVPVKTHEPVQFRLQDPRER